MGAQTDQPPHCLAFNALRVRFFGRIQKRICDLSSFGSWGIKGTDDSLSRVDLSVPLMHHDPNDLRSQIRFWILPKRHTINIHLLGDSLESRLFSLFFMRVILLHMCRYKRNGIVGTEKQTCWKPT